MNGVVNYDYREIGLQYETYWHILNLNVIVGLIVFTSFIVTEILARVFGLGTFMTENNFE